MNGVRIQIRGIVQGVGFRPWVYRIACEEGIAGSVSNDSAGVIIEAFGSDGRIQSFLKRLETPPPPAASVRELTWDLIEPRPASDFVIRPSSVSMDRIVSIPPDLATCIDCEREIRDPGDRRFGYAFTNCTNCGPRFTITRGIPYDRAATTMAGFVMCEACQREYDDPENRRFHAQPNACRDCGPRLVAVRPDGHELTGDAIATASAAIQSGQIVAIKGLGGFHLACDATNPRAILRLRERKRRDEKPFAVMTASLADAERLACLSEQDRGALTSIERPIVLLRRRQGSGLAAEIAPGNPLVGLMLPYTPLHHLLLDFVSRPLVMTSGNLSEEPIAQHNEEALRRLAEIADLFLIHDRDIETRCDDSVVRVLRGSPVVLRRSRGHVPRPMLLERNLHSPILACGAHLKNTFAIGTGERMTMGPHIGDLENLETLRFYEEAIERMERFLQVEPEVIAYDLHPLYLSTEYAMGRSEPAKIGVQHHHAHVVSAMAENRIEGPALGIAFDGTGFGLDGASWGGEILLAELHDFYRVATLRPILLAGGDLAIRETWRSALALLLDAFEGNPPLDAIPLFDAIPSRDLDVVRTMIERQFNSPPAHGAGRYFDAFGAMFLGRPRSSYEGQIALEWNLAADGVTNAPYPFDIDVSRTPWEMDLRPAVRAAVADLLRRESIGVISARFHAGLASVTAEVLALASERFGSMPVVYSGGCFQNELLLENLVRLTSNRFELKGNQQIPPGDGGIAFGQAIVADATFRKSMGGPSCV